MTPEETRSRLGWLVAERRKALGLSKDAAARAADISRLTWRKVEDGGTVRDTIYAAVERALGWVPGDAEAALAGGTPRVQVDMLGGEIRAELTDDQAGSVRLAARMLEAIRAEYGDSVYLAALDEVERSQDEADSQQNRQSSS